MRSGGGVGFGLGESGDRMLGFLTLAKTLVDVYRTDIERKAGGPQQIGPPRRTRRKDEAHGRECYTARQVSPTILMDSLHSVVPRALTELFRHGPLSQGKLEVAWRVAVGDTLARVTSVRLQPDGVVEVRTADQRWDRELKRSSGMILTRLIGLLGDGRVSRVVVK